MNRLCHIVENHFRDYVRDVKSSKNFDSSILKTDTGYNKTQLKQLKELYSRYNKELADFMKISKEKHINDEDKNISMQCLIEEYRRKCVTICPDKDKLCNILVDICYSKERTKQFAWDMCGSQIIDNLLNNKYYSYGWIYTAKFQNGADDYIEKGIYPQAERNFMLKISYSF
jgi:hypothetical protein